MMIEKENADIFCITESWVNEKHLNSALVPQSNDYIIARCDRKNKKGGGVAALIRSHFVHNIVSTLSSEWFKSIVVDLFFTEGPIRVVIVYFKPAGSKENIESLTDYLSQYISIDCPCVVLGDFNMPQIDWTNSSCSGPAQSFLEFCKSANLVQCIDFCTRNKSILDLVLTSDPRLLKEKRELAPPKGCDHCFISFKI